MVDEVPTCVKENTCINKISLMGFENIIDTIKQLKLRIEGWISFLDVILCNNNCC